MSELIVKEMCDGCGRKSGNICKIIKEPKWIFEHRGTCFAKVTPERAKQIEDEIREARK